MMRTTLAACALLGALVLGSAASAAIELPDDPVVQWLSGPDDAPHRFTVEGPPFVHPDAHEKFNPAEGFTLSVHVRPEGFSRLAGIASQYRSSRAGAWYLALHGREPYRGLQVVMIDEVEYPGGYKGFGGADVLVPGQWHHVLLVFDGKLAQLLCDGRLVASRELDAPLLVPEGIPLSLGGRARTADFEGQMRDLRIFARPLDVTDMIVGENYLRNSDFEMGDNLADALAYHRMAGSDYVVPENPGWELASEGARFGRQCLKGDGSAPLHLNAEVWERLPGPEGWTFSAYLRADREDVPVELRVGSYLTLAQEIQSERITVGREWRRYHIVTRDFHANRRRSGGRLQGPMNFWVAPLEQATLWVDGVQWEAGSQPLRYAPSPRDVPPVVEEFELLPGPKLPEMAQAQPPAGQRPGTVPIVVHHEGSERAAAAPVSLGVPFPRGAWHGGRVSLASAAGAAVDAQHEVLSQWRQDGSVQSLGLYFQSDLAPGRNEFRLRYAPAARPATPPSLLERANGQPWRARLRHVAVEVHPQSGNLWEGIADAGTGETLFAAASLHAVGLDGTRYSSLHAPEIVTEVEKEGPVHVSIAKRGLLADGEGRAALMFIARLHLWRDAPGAQVELTLVNTRPVDSVALREVYWETRAPAGGRARLPWRLADAGEAVAALQYFDWGREEFRRGEVADGRLTSVREGERDKLHLGLEGGRVGAHLQVLHGWEKHPSMLEAGPQGVLRAYLWPSRPVKAVEFSRGMSITREFALMRTASRPSERARLALAEAYGKPPVGITEPSWFAGVDLLMPVYQSEPERFPFIEGRLTADEMLGRLSPGQIESRNMYGVFDYGDNHGDGGWGNVESYNDFSVLLIGLRNGDPEVVRQGLVSAEHYRDMDINQIRGYCITHNPNHVMGGSGFSHAWPQGVFSHYLLTGSRRSLEVSLRVGEHMLATADLSTGHRTLGRFLLNLVDIYQVTGDERYRERFMAQVEFAENLLREQGDVRYPSMFGRGGGASLVPYHGWYGCAALLKMLRETGDGALLPTIRREVPTTMDMGLYRLDLEELWPGVPPEEGWPIACADFARHRGNMFYPVLVDYAEITGERQWAELALRSLYAGALEGRAVRTLQAALASSALSAVPRGVSEEQLVRQGQQLLWNASLPTLANGDFTMSPDSWRHWRPHSGKSLAHHDNWQEWRRQLVSLDRDVFKANAPSMRFGLTTQHRFGRSISTDSARFRVEPGSHRLGGWFRSDPNARLHRVSLIVSPLDGRRETLTMNIPAHSSGNIEVDPGTFMEAASASVSAPDAEGWRQWRLDFRAPGRCIAAVAFNVGLDRGREGRVWVDGFELAPAR